MSRKPTIIIVHGAFHQPEHFNTVADKLREAGFIVVVPRLPSVGLSSDPGGALHLDAGAVRNALNFEITGRWNDVILVMHSYGGLAGTEGYGIFQQSHPNGALEAGSPRVRRLVYLAAHGAVEKGTALLAPEDVQQTRFSVDGNGILTHVTSFERWYEGDCTREEAQPPMNMCLPMALSAMTTPTKYAAWRDFGTPVTYIKCLNDRAVTPEMCDGYIKRMQEAGVEVSVETMERGHSPAHIAPQELAHLIVRVVG